MRAAERTGQIDRRRDPDTPDDRDLENADLRAGRDRRADAAATEKDEQKVPKNSPIAHFGIGVCATSTSALTCGGGSGRVALIVSLISAAQSSHQQQLPPSQQLLASVVTL